jgi:hypothetical protein
MWYSTVNFDLVLSILLESFVASLPISRILNNYLAPSKVITYFYTFYTKLLQKINLDLGGEIVVEILPNSPLPVNIHSREHG